MAAAQRPTSSRRSDDDFVSYDQSQELPLDPGDETESDAEEPQQKKRRGKDIEYVEVRKFDTLPLFKEYWKRDQENWRLKKRDQLEDVAVELWYCKYGRIKGFACQHRMRIVFPHDDASVVLYESSEDHDHTPAPAASAMTPDVKQFIREQLRNGLAPQRIRVLLSERRVPNLPALKQIQNFTSRERQEDSAPFTDLQLKQYCARHSEDPAGENDPYVLSWRFDDMSQWHVLWTTRKLFSMQRAQTLLQADATNGVNWHSLPLGVFGFSDINRHFTPTCLSVAPSENNYHYESVLAAMAAHDYEPRYVLGDGHAGLTKAVRQVFPGAVRLMCYAHVDRRVTKRILSVPEEFRSRILADIEELRFARSDNEFMRLAELMVQTWPDEAQGFQDYFVGTWVESDLKRWYESSSPFCSTNNGLESINKQIKDAHTLRKKLPFGSFIDAVESILRLWSTGATPPPAIPSAKPHLYNDAYSLQNGPEKRLVARIPQRDAFVYAASTSNLATLDAVKEAYRAYSAQPDTWIGFLQTRFKVHVVKKVTAENATLYTCSCKEGFRKRLCKHALHAMCSPDISLYSYPPDVTAVRLGDARKRGRPKKMQRQNRYAVND